MQFVRNFVLALMAAQLIGCAAGLVDQIDKATYGITGADDLPAYMAKHITSSNAPRPDWPVPPNTGTYSRKLYLLEEINASYQLCGSYRRRLLLASRANNTGFDIATTA